MQKDIKLKEMRVADERVKMFRRMQALKKAEEGLRHRASKIKTNKEKSQHQFYIDPYISVDKNLNGKSG